MLTEKCLIYPVVDSNLFSYLLQNANDGPFIICIQCIHILCDIIMSNESEPMYKVISENFLQCLQMILMDENPSIISLGLDTIIALYNAGLKEGNDQIIQYLKKEDWLPDSINDLCVLGENDEKIVNEARYIHDNIIQNLFGDD